MPKLRAEDKRLFAGNIAALQSVSVVDSFIPNPGGQERFCQTTANEIFLSGGNSTGKTYVGLMKDAWHTLPAIDIHGNKTGYAIHPNIDLRIPDRGVLGWISSWSQDAQRDNIQETFLKIFGPYVTDKRIEAGILHYAEIDHVSKINFKWQTQGKKSYTGAKIDWLHLDEPHQPEIYKEARARLFRSEGYMWSTLTPVIDEGVSEIALRDIMWLKESIIDPWIEDPERYPRREVIFMSLAENKAYISPEFITDMMKGMSELETSVRTHGMFVDYIGNCCFESEVLLGLNEFLRTHPEFSEPEYGTLAYDDVADDENSIVPELADVQSFPTRPKGAWIMKFWEHPMRRSALIRPRYYIGVDVAAGISGGDYTCAYVKRGDGRIVACLHGHLSEIELARQLYLLGSYYCDEEFRPATLAIETNNGSVTQSILLTGNSDLGIPQYDSSRLYMRPQIKSLEQGQGFGSGEYGWYTSSRTRGFLLTEMRKDFAKAFESVEENKPPCIPDRGMVEEGRRFVLNKQGKYEATKGVSNDDRLFASAIADMAIARYENKLVVSENDDVDYADYEDVNFYLDKDKVMRFNIAGKMKAAQRARSRGGGVRYF